MDFRAFRKDLGFTQEEMAREVGVSRPMWAQYELGTAKPRPETAWRIVEVAEYYRRRLTLEDVYPRE